MRICICDDDLRIHNDIKQLIGEFFSQSDIPDFSCFSSGEELLECYLQGNKFDIIFLDVEMSAINGIETAEEIRKKSIKRHGRLHIVTGGGKCYQIFVEM